MLNIYLTSFHMILLMVTQKADVLICALAALFCLSVSSFGLYWGEKKVFSCLLWEELVGDGEIRVPKEPRSSLQSGTGDDGDADGSKCSSWRGKENAKNRGDESGGWEKGENALWECRGCAWLPQHLCLSPHRLFLALVGFRLVTLG